MTNDEWNECDDALHMLVCLRDQLSRKTLKKLHPILHSYLLECTATIRHLLPQPIFRMGLDAARKCIDGELDKKVLHWLDWYLEAECFAFDYSANSQEVLGTIAQVEQVRDLPHEQAVAVLRDAAYFAEGAIIGLLPGKRWKRRADFLCSDLLRKFLPAPFDPESLKKASPNPLMTNREWSESNNVFTMIRNLRRLPTEKYKQLKLRRKINEFLLASCDEYLHLLDTPMIQQGLYGARRHLEEPLDQRKRFALWENAFDEVGEYDSNEQDDLRLEAQQLALAAIYGGWPSSRRNCFHLYEPDLLRKFIPAPFDH